MVRILTNITPAPGVELPDVGVTGTWSCRGVAARAGDHQGQVTARARWPL
jgi:hypothetical protein